MIGRADIEGSKSNVAMYAWLPQVSSFIPSSLIVLDRQTTCSRIPMYTVACILLQVGVARTLSYY